MGGKLCFTKNNASEKPRRQCLCGWAVGCQEHTSHLLDVGSSWGVLCSQTEQGSMIFTLKQAWISHGSEYQCVWGGFSLKPAGRWKEPQDGQTPHPPGKPPTLLPSGALSECLGGHFFKSPKAKNSFVPSARSSVELAGHGPWGPALGGAHHPAAGGSPELPEARQLA